LALHAPLAPLIATSIRPAGNHCSEQFQVGTSYKTKTLSNFLGVSFI